MEFLTILGIAVAIATGVMLKKVTPRQLFRLSWHFGFFQAFMPVLGWGAGQVVFQYVAQYGSWIAFGLLFCVGLNMIREAFNEEKKDHQKDPTKGLSLVMLSVATSIDALVIGISISILSISIWAAVLVIGVVAGLFTIFGMYIGKRISSVGRISRFAEVTGGVILIFIGTKILLEHLAA